MREVRFYFDFISPYSWLALERARSFAGENNIRWALRPVSYGALLSKTGLVGPVEISAKREYTFDDVVRCAELQGLKLVGPPAHPFRSLEALRLMSMLRDEPGALELARNLAAAAWSDGRDLAQISVLEDVLSKHEFDLTDLAERLSASEVKTALIKSTDEALQAGVFGVPTFEFEGELFWGCDRLSQLAHRLSGRLRPARARSATLLARPAGIQRKRS